MTQSKVLMNNIKLKHLAVVIIATIPLVICSGCLKCDLTLDITKNGAGFIEVNYSISENAVSQLNALANVTKQLDAVSGRKPETVLKDPDMMLFLTPEEDKLRKRLSVYKKNGLTIDKLRVSSNNAWRNVELRLNFLNIADVARADFFPDAGFSLYRRSNGSYVFLRKSISEAAKNKNILLTADTQRLIAPILEGFDVSIRIHTPGRILDSNAHSKAVASATWTFDQERDPSAFQKLQKQEFVILIDGTDVKIPDIKIVKTTPEPKK